MIHRGACPPHPDTFSFQFAAVKDHELTNEVIQFFFFRI